MTGWLQLLLLCTVVQGVCSKASGGSFEYFPELRDDGLLPPNGSWLFSYDWSAMLSYLPPDTDPGRVLKMTIQSTDIRGQVVHNSSCEITLNPSDCSHDDKIIKLIQRQVDLQPICRCDTYKAEFFSYYLVIARRTGDFFKSKILFSTEDVDNGAYSVIGELPLIARDVHFNIGGEELKKSYNFTDDFTICPENLNGFTANIVVSDPSSEIPIASFKGINSCVSMNKTLAKGRYKMEIIVTEMHEPYRKITEKVHLHVLNDRKEKGDNAAKIKNNADTILPSPMMVLFCAILARYEEK